MASEDLAINAAAAGGVIPVHQEVAELEAVAGDHPELAGSNGLHREPEQATIHHD